MSVITRLGIALCAVAVVSAGAPVTARAQGADAPTYTGDGKMNFPKDYRKWVFLSSGLDMSYLPDALKKTSSFGNVFVNPQSYDAFVQRGTWPDKTTFVLEVRQAEQNGSINRSGRFQTERLRSEIHVKDDARFTGGWAFFAFDREAPATMIPRTANCYSCHQDNGAVDTTFVQFYPTLLPIARAKKTLAPGYAAKARN